jgi:hypothetical protein
MSAYSELKDVPNPGKSKDEGLVDIWRKSPNGE